MASGVHQESEAEDSLQGLEDIPEGWEFRGRRESYYSYYEAVLGLDTGAMKCGTGCFEKAASPGHEDCEAGAGDAWSPD